MTDYTPDIETLWAAYESWSTGNGGSTRAEFDRAIAEVAAKAWDEGNDAGYSDAKGEDRGIGPVEYARNPYREGK